MNIGFKRAFTHGGVFHADDVFATALLLYIKPDLEICRGYQVPEDFDGLVYDIGFGKYDHHQENRRVRKNGVPYAAFGLLWKNSALRSWEKRKHKNLMKILFSRWILQIIQGWNTCFLC